MDPALLKIYELDESFIDFLAHDLDNEAVWFDESEFARYHTINGKKILSILVTETRTRVYAGGDDKERPEGVRIAESVLYCRAQEVAHVTAEQSLRIDGRLYTIKDANLLQDHVWRITLEANK